MEEPQAMEYHQPGQLACGWLVPPDREARSLIAQSARVSPETRQGKLLLPAAVRCPAASARGGKLWETKTTVLFL